MSLPITPKEGFHRPMREAFHRELERLDQDVVRMAALVEAAIDGAILALAEGDLERASRIIEGDDAIDAYYVDIETRAFQLLAQQQPVASELRLVLTILRVATDLERSGDLAHNVARVVRSDVDIVKLRDVSAQVQELGREANRLLGRAIDAWATKDAALAAEIGQMDKSIDQLYRELLRSLREVQDEGCFDLAVNMVLVGRYFERIADHAVNIADRMLYYLTGKAEHLG